MSLTDTQARSAVRSTEPESEAQRRRRGELIEATVDAIAEHGLSHLTLAKVASRAGLTGAMVNFHFTSKQALLAATLNRLYEEYEAAVRRALEAAGDDPRAALRAMIDVHFDPVVSDPRKIAVWYAFWGESRARGDYLAVCGGRDEAQERQFLDLCRRIIAREGYDRLVPEAIAAGLNGLLEQSWQCFLVDDGPSVRAARRRICTAYLASVFPRSFSHDGAPLARAAVETPHSAPGERPASAETTPTQAADWERGGLPPWTYCSPEFTELEKEKLFRRNWLLVGHESEAPGPGDYLTFEAIDERVLVVRGKDGRLRAFHNVCRHRASKVLTERRGTCKGLMVCPFHGWSFDLEGRLRAVPAAETFGDLDKSRYGLKPLELESWHGFIFIRFGGDGPSVRELLKPAEEELAPYRLADLEPYGAYWEREVPLDWKTVHDVDNEGYHVPVAHPGLHRLVGQSYYDEVVTAGLWRSFSRLRDKVSPHWSEGLYQRLLPEPDHLPESHRRAWLYYGLAPNLSMGFYPDMMEFFQAFPIAAGRSVMRGRAYALPGRGRELRAARYLNRRINKLVGEEDNDIAYWSAAGMQSSGFEGAILSDKEKCVRALHDQIRLAIPVARLDAPPAPGTTAERNRLMGG